MSPGGERRRRCTALGSLRVWLRGALAAVFVWGLPPTSNALERLEPATGCYIGMLMGDNDSIPRLSARLGLTPAAFGRFFVLPLTPVIRQSINQFLQEVRYYGGIGVLTLEPFGGLQTVTSAQCDELADLCAQAEADGVGGIMIRFAHEMNGHWYPWGQKPTLYRQTFQLLAAKIHARTTRTAMIWSPNNGIGYPFGNGAYSPTPGSSEFSELDTDNDGILSEGDDMFGPFYPGDNAVDWVGLTVYHWGLNHPWRENEPPVPGEFANTINASSAGSPANYARWFYPRYCADGTHNKPLVIAETAAFYNTQQPGANELAMKRAWIRQIYNISGASADGPDVAATFPKMKCVSWFDHYKRESEAQNEFIDWRASANPLVRSAFVGALRTWRNQQPYFCTAQEFAWTQSANAITESQLPAILPLTGDIAVTLNVKAESACDLEVDLLDENYVFVGGTRIAVVAGSGAVPVTFPLNRILADGAPYRWSIFLTPSGGTYQNAFARYNGAGAIARAITPSVAIEAFPPSVQTDTAFTTRLKYTAAEDSWLELTLSDMDAAARGKTVNAVKRGHDVVELTLTPDPGNSAGDYLLTGTLSSSRTNPPVRVAQSAAVPIRIANSPLPDAATLNAASLIVPKGEVLRFVVGYAASTGRDLRVELSDVNATVVARAVQPVSAGSGTGEMTMAYPLASSDTYNARAYLVAPGGSSAQAVASSSVQSVRIVSQDYWSWALGQWGVIFGDDAIDPLSDPDFDRATNQDEYIALSHPRDGASRFKASILPLGQGLRLTWPSVLGRSYQVFARSDFEGIAWSQATNVQPGTGGTMAFDVDLNTSGSQHFYRVQVSRP